MLCYLGAAKQGTAVQHTQLECGLPSLYATVFFLVHLIHSVDGLGLSPLRHNEFLFLLLLGLEA
jgi:hypothetical protein